MTRQVSFGDDSPDDQYPFGMEPSFNGDAYMVKCLGEDCKRKFGSLKDYAAHDCPNPDSGETFR